MKHRSNTITLADHENDVLPRAGGKPGAATAVMRKYAGLPAPAPAQSTPPVQLVACDPSTRAAMRAQQERDAAFALGYAPPSAPVQLSADAQTGLSDDQVRAAASQGTSGSASPLPHRDAIQRSFGSHDISSVTAHIGGSATQACDTLSAHAYATGDHIAFARQPDLALAAHEAAHVVQQRAGVHLSSATGQPGDAYEQQADAVADAVVRGESAEALLGAVPGSGGSTGVQLRKSGKDDEGFKKVRKGVKKTGGGTVEATLVRLTEEGLIGLSPTQIALLNAMAVVETGGKIGGVNTYDDQVVSIGFKQVTLGHGSLEKVMRKAPGGFAKHGLSLNASETYRKRGGWSTSPSQIAGCADAEELRKPEWAIKFYNASMEPDVIAALVDLALLGIAKVEATTKKRAGGVDLFDDPTATAWLLQTLNNRPAFMPKAVELAISRGAKTIKDRDKFLDVLAQAIIDTYIKEEPLLRYRKAKQSNAKKGIKLTPEQDAALLTRMKAKYEPIGRGKGTNITTKISRNLPIPKLGSGNDGSSSQPESAPPQASAPTQTPASASAAPPEITDAPTRSTSESEAPRAADQPKILNPGDVADALAYYERHAEKYPPNVVAQISSRLPQPADHEAAEGLYDKFAAASKDVIETAIDTAKVLFGHGIDEAFVQAVAAYQSQNGLGVDGVAGKNTLIHMFGRDIRGTSTRPQTSRRSEAPRSKAPKPGQRNDFEEDKPAMAVPGNEAEQIRKHNPNGFVVVMSIPSAYKTLEAAEADIERNEIDNNAVKAAIKRLNNPKRKADKAVRAAHPDAEVNKANLVKFPEWRKILADHQKRNNDVFESESRQVALYQGAISGDDGAVKIGKHMVYRTKDEIAQKVSTTAKAVAQLLAANDPQPGDEQVAKVRGLSLASHGSSRGTSGRGAASKAGYTKADVPEIMAAMAEHLTADVKIRLFACRTAASRKKGSLADAYRDALHSHGKDGGAVVGHTTSGRATMNPNTRYLSASGTSGHQDLKWSDVYDSEFLAAEASRLGLTKDAEIKKLRRVAIVFYQRYSWLEDSSDLSTFRTACHAAFQKRYPDRGAVLATTEQYT